MIYKVYWTNKDSNLPASAEFDVLTEALRACENMRNLGHKFVTMVSDYADMVGKPGAQGASIEYVPQMLNP